MFTLVEENDMIILLLLSLVICGVLVMFNCFRIAIYFGVFAIVACFGYRYWIGREELRAIIADALFCLAVLLIGWWAEKQFHQIVDGRKEANHE